MRFTKLPNFSDYLQSEEAECGLMCLAASTAVLGGAVEAAEIRRSYGASIRGLTLGKVCDLAASLRMFANPVSCSVAELKQLTIPAILHWRGDHFVLLIEVSRRDCLIFDPASGLSTVPLSAAQQAFSGSAIQLRAAPDFARRRSKPKFKLRPLLDAATGAKSRIAQLIVLSLLIQMTALTLPLLTQVAINFGAVRGNVAALTTITICIAFVYGFSSVAEFWRSLINHKVASSISLASARMMFKHLLALPLPWHQRRRLADTATRFDSIEPVRNAISNGLPSLFIDGALAIFLALVMFYVSPLMATVIVGSVLLTILLKASFTPVIVRQGGEALSARIQEQSKRLETFRSIQTLKLGGAELAKERDWASAFERNLGISDRSLTLTALQQSLTTLVGGFGNLATLFFGALMVSSGELSVGGLFAFVMYRRYLADKATMAFDQINAIALLRFHLQRIAEVHEAEVEPRSSETRVPDHYVQAGRIEFSDLAFRHTPTDRWLFTNLSAHIEPGELVVISGESGVGKSTLLRVISGLYLPSAGDVRYDGISLGTMNPRVLRKSIGAVTQEDELLCGTILENVSMFDDHPDHARCSSALKAAQILEDVRKMPLGVHTPVGEGGCGLSAGQRQRLMLARALYRRPQLLVLDEATSNVDAATEEAIFQGLKQLRSTKIVVTHDDRLCRFADRVFVLDQKGIRLAGRSIQAMEMAV